MTKAPSENRPAAKKRAPNLADVASRAGVDVSTVSRVLHSSVRHRVSDSTRTRIMEAAAEIGYQPNLLARGLRTSRTRTISIIVPEIRKPPYADIIDGAARAVAEHDYTLLIAHHDETASHSIYERIAQANRVDGFIVASLRPDKALFATLEAAGVPFVIANRKVDGVENSVAVDAAAATEMVVSHLIELGHRRIAYISRGTGYYNDDRRIEGYRAALVQAGLAVDPKLEFHFPEGPEPAVEQIVSRAAGERPTAIVTVNLLSAGLTINALRKAGVRVPQEMSVVALYDEKFADIMQPPVTTVELPFQEVGHVAASYLIAGLEGRSYSGELTLPPTKLLLRESSAPANGGA